MGRSKRASRWRTCLTDAVPSESRDGDDNDGENEDDEDEAEDDETATQSRLSRH